MTHGVHCAQIQNSHSPLGMGVESNVGYTIAINMQYMCTLGWFILLKNCSRFVLKFYLVISASKIKVEWICFWSAHSYSQRECVGICHT